MSLGCGLVLDLFKYLSCHRLTHRHRQSHRHRHRILSHRIAADLQRFNVVANLYDKRRKSFVAGFGLNEVLIKVKLQLVQCLLHTRTKRKCGTQKIKKSGHARLEKPKEKWKVDWEHFGAVVHLSAKLISVTEIKFVRCEAKVKASLSLSLLFSLSFPLSLDLTFLRQPTCEALCLNHARQPVQTTMAKNNAPSFCLPLHLVPPTKKLRTTSQCLRFPLWSSFSSSSSSSSSSLSFHC